MALVAAGLATVSLPSGPAAAAAVGEARPIAVAVDSDGTSYVGYASGGALSRLSNSGRRLAPLALDDDGPVVGLAVDGADYLWVAQDDAITKLTLEGEVVRRIERTPADTCADDDGHSSARFGGLAVGGDQVYVASRCTAVVEVYDRATGAAGARVALPGARKARGLAWLRPFQGKAARLFVAVPASAQVLTYAAGTLSATAAPSQRTTIDLPGRGRRAVPAGLAVDAYGRLSVSDVANHAILMYTTTSARYSQYRVLGHPSVASDAIGHLNYPAAFAQYPQDKGALSGNVFVADTRNGRVQRWDSGGGYTFWVKALSPPVVGDPEDPVDPDEPTDPEPADGDPVNAAPPRITLAAGGDSLSCATGTWSDTGLSYTFRWLRDGTLRSGVAGSSYALSGADDGTEITCRVTATSTTGSTTVTSPPYFVGTPVVPASTTRPAIVGTPARGNTLTCSTGGWTGAPTPQFAYVWLRDGVSVATTPTYRVVAADLGASLTCTVIATNQAGSSSASSDPVVPSGVGDPDDPDDPDDPTTGPCDGAPRVVIAGGAARVGRPAVTLQIVPPVGYTGVEVSNDAAFATPTEVTLSSACTTAWTLVAPASDATPAHVYVRWVGGPSAGLVVTDTVLLDRTGPSLTSATVRFVKKAWRLRVHAQDPSGLATITYGRTQTQGLRTVSAAASVRVPAPHDAKWVRVTDRFGNVSGWIRTT